MVPTPEYGGDGRLTRGVLREQAECWRGDSTGGDAVIASMDRGEGLGFAPRGFDVVVVVVDVVVVESLPGGGVNGDRGGGDGSGDL